MNKDKLPSIREAAILTILINGERYGREIRKEYEERTGQKMLLGTLYVLLSRMEREGLVRSRAGEATKMRGDNRRRYFQIDGGGREALAAFEEYLMSAMRGRLQWICT